MDDKNKNTDKPFNPRAVAELRDRLVWFIATCEMQERQRFHWVGGCAPVVKQ